MAQNMPGNPAENYTSSGQAGGGSGTVFGDLGGGVQHGTDLPYLQDGPRNSGGHPTSNPSGDGVAPPLDSVFGTDLGGSGVAGQTGGAQITNQVPSMGPPGQGGR
jgi:hypothetical protein